MPDEYRICGTCRCSYKVEDNYFFCSMSCSSAEWDKTHPQGHAYDTDGYYLGIRREGIDDLSGLDTEPADD